MRKVTVNDVAQFYGVTIRTVYNWINKNSVTQPKRTPGGVFYWEVDSIEEINNGGN